MAGLSADARKRLNTLEEFSGLGDGFKIAMKDLDIRGAGNLLGGEQSGYINDVGFDTYYKILEESVQEVKENQFKELFQKELDLGLFRRDCVLETDLEILIPEEYVNNITERLRLYNELDNTKDEKKLEEFASSIIDRFGPLPDPFQELIQSVRLRWEAERLGFEKLVLKNGIAKGYVTAKDNDAYFQSPTFGTVLKFTQVYSKRCSLKDIKGKMILSISNVSVCPYST